MATDDNTTRILQDLARINASVVRPKQEAMRQQNSTTKEKDVVAGSQTVPSHRQSSVCDVDSVDLPVCELSGVSSDAVSAGHRCPHSPRRAR